MCRSKLTACYVQDCSYFGIDRASLNRCKILNNTWSSWSASEASKFSNCLFASNENPILKSCTFANCTVADNTKFAMSKSKAYNTIFFKVAASQFKSSKKNTFSKCYKGASPKFVSTGDYHLAKGSPCINKGTKAASVKKLFGSKDLDGKKRIKGKTVDIGCY